MMSLEIRTVLDVGCGAGAWLSVWKQNGCQITGLDGDYVDPAAMLIDQNEFNSTDLSKPFAVGTKFDLCQCLEVAEHLPHSAAAGFVSTLCESADIVLFSAAAANNKHRQ